MHKRNLDHLTTKNIMREIISTASTAVGEAGGNVFDLTHILGTVLMAIIIEHTPDDMVIAAFDVVTSEVREHAATMFPQKGNTTHDIPRESSGIHSGCRPCRR